MSLPRAELALPDPRAARRAFDRAASSFDAASVAHDLTRERLLERLDYMQLAPATVVDVGCATGKGAASLAERYPESRIVAIDTSLPMLRVARDRAMHRPGAGPGVAFVGGNAEELPINDGGAHLLFANMLLPWARPRQVFLEAARVLPKGGLLLFATLGPDTLEQVRRAWAAVDDHVHVHACFDMHDLGDLAVASGLAEPVVDVDRIALTYRDVESMMLDLRSCGAVNVAAGRRRTLTGPRRWRRFADALDASRRDGRIAITLELILGHAWGTGRRPSRGAAGSETSVAVADIGIIRRSRR